MASLAEGNDGTEEMFYIEHLSGDTVCIRSKEGFLWSLKTMYQNAITASETMIGLPEKFTFQYINENDNKIALKASNGKYVSIGSQWPFIIKANSDVLSREETFRYILKGN